MQYQIVLPPDIRVSPEAFADAWNADEQSSVVAEARLKPAQTRSYDPLTVSTVVVDHQIGLGGAALYDLVKHVLSQALDQPSTSQRIEVREIDQPDGGRLLVVHIKK